LRGEDFDVLADGKVVGRIYEQGSASMPPELGVLGSITEVVRALGMAISTIGLQPGNEDLAYEALI
jgi:hypothetical protein